MFEIGANVMFRGEQVIVVEKFTGEKYKNFKLTRNAIYVVEFDGGYRQDVMESDLERVGYYVERMRQKVKQGPIPTSKPYRKKDLRWEIRNEKDVDKALIDAHLRFGQYDVVRVLSEKERER